MSIETWENEGGYMPKKEVVTVPVSVTYECDECGEEMTCNSVLTSMPPIYVHGCKNGHRMNSDKQYPRIEHREIPGGSLLL